MDYRDFACLTSLCQNVPLDKYPTQYRVKLSLLHKYESICLTVTMSLVHFDSDKVSKFFLTFENYKKYFL